MAMATDKITTKDCHSGDETVITTRDHRPANPGVSGAPASDRHPNTNSATPNGVLWASPARLLLFVDSKEESGFWA